ncbi:MAG: ribonuclease R family protein [Leptolyngbyaceae bacterium]|nr:ribonuclease R family protein [Leptolyngbyaceae bacterium]
MSFSIASLMASFPDEKLVAPKALEKKLECEDDDSVRRLQIALDALEKIGILVKDRGRYRRVFEDDVVEGKLRCSSKGFCFAIQDDESAEDIYVREAHLNTAWNGDRVLVKVTKDGTRRRSPEGEVRLILERANQSVLGRVKQANGDFHAVPLDDRLLFELVLAENGVDLKESVDQLVHVEILRYPLGQDAPVGRIAKVLGTDAEEASDIDIVCCKHDLPREFSEAVQKAAKALPTRLRKSDLKDRLDLRNVPTFRIVGATLAELPTADDAISLESLSKGRWRLGVHIADIAQYVEHRSPLDREAERRGTSVYLGETVLPMLPELVHRRCALQVGSDRLAISVLITLNEAGEVLEFEIQPTLVNVDYELSYQQAQAILERRAVETQKTSSPTPAKSRPIRKKSDADPPSADTTDLPAVTTYRLPSLDEVKQFEPIFEILDHLLPLSQAMREQRRKQGAFELTLPDQFIPDESGKAMGKYLSTKFQYDDEGALGALVVSSLLPARSIVIESMLLANQIVASHLKALQVPAIYRVHRMPDMGVVQELFKLISNMGLEPTLENEEEVRPQDYQRLTQQIAESNVEKVLTYLLLDTLKPGHYSTQPGPHFGLALEEGYTHFTSPLRRYPDLLIHRVLHAVFEQGRDRRSARSKERVQLRHSSCHGKISWNILPTKVQDELEQYFSSITNTLTEREKLAQDAEADLEGLKKAEFMQQHTGSVFHGLITGVQSYGFFVEIEELLVEGLVHVSSLKDDWYEYRSRQQKLVGRKNRKQYRLGDRVEVQVKSVDYYRQQIDLVAVGGGSEATDFDDPEDDDETTYGIEEDFDTDGDTDEDDDD